MPTQVTLVSPLETNGGIPVNLQDQTTTKVLEPFYINEASFTLASDTVVNGTTLSLTAGHGFTPGDLLVLHEGANRFHAFVLAVVVDDVSVDTPIDKVFTTSASGYRGTANLNVNGSSAIKTARVMPPPGVSWDVTRMHLYIADEVAMDGSKFGGITALTKGCVLRESNGVINNIANAKSNGDLIQFASDHLFADKIGGGEYYFYSRHVFAGQQHMGATFRLHGAETDELQILIQDNLTALTKLVIVAIGHVVTD